MFKRLYYYNSLQTTRTKDREEIHLREVRTSEQLERYHATSYYIRDCLYIAPPVGRHGEEYEKVKKS